jgi:hypothetical protein
MRINRMVTMLAHLGASSISLGEWAMGTEMKSADGSLTLAELREFASFPSATQRYIRRSLDVAFDRTDAVALWSRDIVEAAAIKAQASIYRALIDIRRSVPSDSGLGNIEELMGPLMAVTAFDLGQDRIYSFGAYRFLYERLVGAGVRPWLPAAFCGASSMPHLPPERRRELLQSISEAAATAPGWSTREPAFYPEWVEKVDA